MAEINYLETGAELAVTAWDILSGDIKAGSQVLIYDETGDHTGLQTAETLTEAGARVDMLTPDRSISRDVPGMNLSPYLKTLQSRDVTFTQGRRLVGIAKNGNHLTAKIGTDYSDHFDEKDYDQIIVNQGVVPMDDLYLALKPQSSNLGEVDYEALIEGRPQTINSNPNGAFQLFRIGDAVSARNIHAGIYDALRLVRHL